MKILRAIAVLLAVTLVAAPLAAQEEYEVRMPQLEPHFLQSKIMDYKFGIYVTLPDSYNEQPERMYPTVYILDGHQYWVFTGEPYGSLVWGNMVKEHISVAVAYTREGGNNRSRDFDPDRRAPDFVRFLRTELIPFVESNFRTTGKQDRTLFGHSAGGRFTFYNLFTATDLFDKYILSAPAVTEGLFALEEAYAGSHDDLPVTVFIACGEDDNLSINAKFMDQRLRDRKYPTLKISSMYVPDGNHGTIQPTAYIEGLRFVMDPALELAPEAYRRLAGSYRDGNNVYRLSYEGGNYLRFEGVPLRENGTPIMEFRKIYARSANEFFAKGRPSAFSFGGDPGQPAKTFSFRSDGEDIVATRVD